ncbi:malate synthase A [Micromonospora sp. DR5-3]|uniref:malate synthase A n=1 Tax=unclassified Micromonospora TaxID=2617518 RepID=UPI0011DC51D6|nr:MULTISPECIES: malate synthase A [unclassified Micromonospora]MCW3818786.1 malate synthase A [Micromonospora sp. DR5-3]TYC21574.1 malate synthase A [Micromonospora sp. MP36]
MSIEVTGSVVEGGSRILVPAALQFVAELHRRFGARRVELLDARRIRRAEVARTGKLDFLADTAHIRAAQWQVAPAPEDLRDRRVEITGPTDRKMTINALNAGARVWLADLEDASTPHWSNVIGGQVNLYDAIRRNISFASTDGKVYRLRGDRRLATIVMRPRGWHLDEKHVLVDGEPVAGAFVDFGLYFFHNAKELLERGSGPYFYLPKMESHREARLWNEVFTFAQDRLGVPYGSIRATVLIETIPAAFEMEEILYELRDHASGLNAGRWDYLFSVIKYFRDSGPRFVLPDRAAVAMTAPFMKAYAELLVKTCHKRGAFAMGGMSAFIPSRRDEQVNVRAFEQVKADKNREAGQGFDGSWVAHPDLVPLCVQAFDHVLGGEPNQVSRQRDDVQVTADDLLDVASTPGSITRRGLHANVEVAILYLESWLRGTGAVGIHNLMEDAATAEISRSQVWQWVHNASKLDDGAVVTAQLVREVVDTEMANLRAQVGDGFDERPFQLARDIFEDVALSDEYVDFLTLPAYNAVVAR